MRKKRVEKTKNGTESQLIYGRRCHKCSLTVATIQASIKRSAWLDALLTTSAIGDWQRQNTKLLQISRRMKAKSVAKHAFMYTQDVSLQKNWSSRTQGMKKTERNSSQANIFRAKLGKFYRITWP